MKKFAVIALALTIGVTCSFAASLKVPWFVDNAASNTGLPPTGGSDTFAATTTIVYLANTTDTQLDCTIAYYSAEGTFLGPDQNGSDNTFIIDPGATVAFRPVATDPAEVATPLGQENPASGNLIPNRPRDVDTKKNGSILITYQGGAADLGGQVSFFSQGSTRSTAFSSAHALIPLFGAI